MPNDVTTLLAAESRPQIDTVREFLCTLDPSGQRSLLDFIQGAKFMQSLMVSQSPAQVEQDRA